MDLYANIETGQFANEIPRIIVSRNSVTHNATITQAKVVGWRKVVSEEVVDRGFTVTLWKFANVTATTCRREVGEAVRTPSAEMPVVSPIL